MRKAHSELQDSLLLYQCLDFGIRGPTELRILPSLKFYLS